MNRRSLYRADPTRAHHSGLCPSSARSSVKCSRLPAPLGAPPVPRKLFVLLSDLKTVRVTCRQCSGATEVLVDSVNKWAELPKCSACHKEIDTHSDADGSLL